MKNILIMGATGMIGGEALLSALMNPKIEQVKVIVRHSTKIKHPKLTEIIEEDFGNFQKLKPHLKGVDACIYCIGVYTGCVSKEVFSKVTVDMTRDFASLLKQESPNTTFCFLSAAGADETQKSKILFMREKGKAENILKSLDFKVLNIFRPWYIYPVVPRKEPTFFYKIMRVIYPNFLAKIWPNCGITSRVLATAMVKSVFKTEKLTVFENHEIKEFYK